MLQIPLSGLPLSKKPYDIYVICEDCLSIESVSILPCGSDNPTLIPQTPKKAGSVNWWSVSNVILPNSDDNLICVMFTGNVKGNSTFKRFAQQKLSISALSFNAQMSPSSGQVYSNSNINVTFSVTNLGNENDSFTIMATSSAGFAVTYIPNSLSVASNQTVSNFVMINANSSIGTISNIELTVTSNNNPSQYDTTDFTVFIIDPNPDVTAPNCTVTYNTASSCPKDSNLCNTAEYIANLAFYDIGTGVSRISYSDGDWNVTETNLFNTSSAANHIFYANGVISCCNNTEFDVIDGASLVGECEVNVTYPPPSTTPSPNNGSYGPCYGIVFAGEMSKYITETQKRDFYNLILQIVKNIGGSDLQYGITTFGDKVLHELEFQNKINFITTISKLIADLPKPDSSTTFVQMVLDDILDSIHTRSGQRITTLFMGENEGIRDPNAGHTASIAIAATGSNVFVLDYSKGIIPTSLWPYLTNNKMDRIINGTGKTVNQLYNALSDKLIYQLNNGLC